MLDMVPQLVVFGGLAVALLGRKDAVMMSRAVGRFLGRSVVKIQGVREKLTTTITEESISGMHPELRDGFKSLIAAQSEMRSATMNPVHAVQHVVMSRAVTQEDPKKEGAESPPPVRQAAAFDGQSYVPPPNRARLYAYDDSPTAEPAPSAPAANSFAAAASAASASASSSSTAASAAPHAVPPPGGGPRRASAPVTEQMAGGADLLVRSLELQMAAGIERAQKQQEDHVKKQG